MIITKKELTHLIFQYGLKNCTNIMCDKTDMERVKKQADSLVEYILENKKSNIAYEQLHGYHLRPSC